MHCCNFNIKEGRGRGFDSRLLHRFKMEEYEDEETMKVIGYLEEQGAITWGGIDENGEALFYFNMEILREVMPELYDDIIADLDTDLLKLYEQGLVEVEYDEDLNASFRITEKGQKYFEMLQEEDE